MSALGGGIMLYRGEAVSAEARKLVSMGTDTYLLELALRNFDGDYYGQVDLLKGLFSQKTIGRHDNSARGIHHINTSR